MFKKLAMIEPGTLPSTLLCIISLSPHSSLIKQVKLISLFLQKTGNRQGADTSLKCIPIDVL